MTRRERVRAQAEADVAEFNENVPVGSSVVYWKGVRAGAGEAGKTTHPAFVLATNIAVVWIDTHHACVALTHVTPVGGLHEQAYRNQCYHSMAVARQAALNAARDGVPTREPYWCSCGFVHVRVFAHAEALRAQIAFIGASWTVRIFYRDGSEVTP